MDALNLKLCDIQGRLFELSGKSGYASIPFITAFMNSPVAENLDAIYNRMQWAGEEYLLEELTATVPFDKNGPVFSNEVLYWTGYLYRYWHFMSGESSKKILRQAPAKVMNTNYLMFHTMDPAMAIEDLKEMAKQRKQ